MTEMNRREFLGVMGAGVLAAHETFAKNFETEFRENNNSREFVLNSLGNLARESDVEYAAYYASGEKRQGNCKIYGEATRTSINSEDGKVEALQLLKTKNVEHVDLFHTHPLTSNAFLTTEQKAHIKDRKLTEPAPIPPSLFNFENSGDVVQQIKLMKLYAQEFSQYHVSSFVVGGNAMWEYAVDRNHKFVKSFQRVIDKSLDLKLRILKNAKLNKEYGSNLSTPVEPAGISKLARQIKKDLDSHKLGRPLPDLLEEVLDLHNYSIVDFYNQIEAKTNRRNDLYADELKKFYETGVFDEKKIVEVYESMGIALTLHPLPSTSTLGFRLQTPIPAGNSFAGSSPESK